MINLNPSLENIRDAQVTDHPFAVPLIIQAMEDLACLFTQCAAPQLAIPLFSYFFQKTHNQYSYENTIVYEINKQVVGAITAYDGANLQAFRQPFLHYIEQEYQAINFHIEDETEAGEFYIDAIGVSPMYQGKGIGRKLILACIEKAVHLKHQKVGLLVDIENPQAKKLYTRLGFQHKKWKEFMGGHYEHMQLDL